MMNLRTKLLLGFGALLALLLVVSALSIVVILGYTQAIDVVLHQNYDSVIYGQKMREAVDVLTFQAQGVAYAGAEQDAAFQAEQAKAKKLFDENLAKENHNITLSGEGAAADDVGKKWQHFQQQLKDLLASPNSGEMQRRYAGLLESRNNVNAAAQQIIDMNLINLISVDGETKSWARRSLTALCVLLAAGLLLGTVLIAFVGRWILQPLRSLTRSVHDIESGNLNTVLPVRSKDEIGQLTEAFNSMATNLREFRRTDQAKLLRTQQTTQLAIDSLPDAVAVISPEGQIDLANGTARRLFNLLPGTAVATLNHEWLMELFKWVRDQKRPQEPQGYEHALQVFDNGTERFFLPHGIPVQDGSRLVGVTLVLIDVTRLRQIDEMKSSLVSTVSHELRTPLTSIRLANHLLLSDRIGELNAKQTEVALEARDNADRLQRIIENLLDMSRIESGRTPFEFAPISPHELAVESADQVRIAAQDKGVELAVDVGVDLPKVHADRSRIGHVLGNLLNNALRYTPAGGKVTLSAEAEKDQVVFRVADTGTGIPTAYLGRVFERFFRVPGQNNTGVGLGLAIAREIVAAHRGAIGVESQEGVGTTFHFTLPMEQIAAPQHVGSQEVPYDASHK